MSTIHIESTSVSCIHNTLNYIYSLAENVFKTLKVDDELKVSYGFFNGNYIKINGKYEYQKYPIPIISIATKGDIGFDLHGIWFEFFLDKNNLKKSSLKDLIDNYNIEIYGGNNCLIDFYDKDKSIQNTLKDISSSNEETIGISIYLSGFGCLNIKNTFLHVCNILNI